MKVIQRQWTRQAGWHDELPPDPSVTLVLAFGGSEALDAERGRELRQAFPGAVLAGCSTAGEILGEQVHDDTIVATAISFDATRVCAKVVDVPTPDASHAAGASLGTQLASADLVHVLVFSDGLQVNGSALTAGLREALPAHVSVTGGLAGDGTRFSRTWVLTDSAAPRAGCVVAVGLYGTQLRVGYGSLGGWDAFGIDREITRSAGNILYELDGKPALSLYKHYLGTHAAELPASGLLFPLALRDPERGDLGLVRTILGVNEADQSMTFAGDMPEGMMARMMKANFDRLVDGAIGAAQAARQGLQHDATLALLVSCVGRRLVLKQRIEDELDGVREALGPAPLLTGFYSYGEISPYTPTARCELHNQTMTITTFAEE